MLVLIKAKAEQVKNKNHCGVESTLETPAVAYFVL